MIYFLTIHLFHRDLSKDVQVRSVENPAKDAIQARVVVVKQSLIGYSVGHEPHHQEEEEEEDIFHLKRRKSFSCYNAIILVWCELYGDVSHHLANDDDFWPQLFVNGKDVDETEGEDHVVHTQEFPANSVRQFEHPETRSEGNTVW